MRVAATGAEVAKPAPNVVQDARRTRWIDIAKGLGIFFIVLGHSLSPGFWVSFVFLFHVPLFFFLSGYLHKPQPNLQQYLRKKAFYLLVPYAAFLIVYAAIQSFKIHRTDGSFPAAIENWLWGGTHLGGYFSIFWFISCLFLTQQLMNWLIVTLKPRALVLTVAAFLCASYLNATVFPFTLPLDANVVLASSPFFLAGYACRGFVLPRWVAVAAIAIAATAVVLIKLGISVSYDMKFGEYGIPLLSFVLSLGCIYSIILLSQFLQSVPLASKFLTALGAASMGIMYLHPLALNRVRALPLNEWVIFVIALLASWFVTMLLAAWTPTRMVFLGTR